MALNTKKHYIESPGKVLARVEAYKIRLKNAEGSHTIKEKINIRNEQNDNCYYCNKKLFNTGEY